MAAPIVCFGRENQSTEKIFFQIYKILFTNRNFCGILFLIKSIDGGTHMEIKKFNVGDVLVMKKPHPCDKKAIRFSVMTVGSDIKVKCLHCSREVMVPRVKLEKSIKSIEPKE